MGDHSNSLLDAALRYAELGYRVFPCVPGGKTPLTTNGFHDAATDPEQIERWWTANPSANIGLATEGLLVVDVDGRDNPWLSDQPERRLDLAAAPTSMTPRGGRHHVFRQPEGQAWRSTAGKLAERVDTRANGGYIVVPPSVMADGLVYEWVNGLELDVSQDRLPEPPAWLAAHFGPGSPTSATVASVSTGTNEIRSGARNATLARLAGSMRRVGMSRAEISAALQQVNADRCIPPMLPVEVARIAKNIARYEPDQIATAMAEGAWEQLLASEQVAQPLSLFDLVHDYPGLRPPIIHGLLRRGETMNVIAASKQGKSWLVTDLALSIATGRSWLGTFDTVPGNVLIIDNELHRETSAHRIPKVAEARGIALDDVGRKLFVQNLRGQLKDIRSLGNYFRSLEKGRFQAIILDAFYRFMPSDTDENDNGAMATIYNHIDNYADLLGCSFVLIHHTSKGNQSSKAVTDVGAGAGSQSRATDTHLVLRPHEEDEVVVLDAAVRSWAPIAPRCLRWTFPIWSLADDLDPALLRSEKGKRKEKAEPESTPEEPWTVHRFVSEFATEAPLARAEIIERAEARGLSNRKAVMFLQSAEHAGLVFRRYEGRGKATVYSTKPMETQP